MKFKLDTSASIYKQEQTTIDIRSLPTDAISSYIDSLPTYHDWLLKNDLITKFEFDRLKKIEK